MQNILEAALTARRHGVSIVPVELPGKRPPAGIKWDWRQERLPDEATIRGDLAGKNGSSGFATISGKVSGNQETVDFDLSGEFTPNFEKLVEAEAPGLFGRLAKQKTPSGGDHHKYRCRQATIGGSQKLAHKRVEVDGPGEHEHGGKRYTARQHGGKWFIFPVAIETRGEGGYAVSAPSPGYTIIQQGETGDFHDPPDITPAERETLLRCARALDELPPERVEDGPKQTAPNVAGLRPGEDFNRRGKVLSSLLKIGWKRAGGNPERHHLTRPGKERGISATLYHGRTLRVFSSNAGPFEENKNYSAFAVFALLEHGGDFTAAARELGRQGYGDPPRAKDREPQGDQYQKPEPRSDPGDQGPEPEAEGSEQTEPAGGPLLSAVLEAEDFINKEMPPKLVYLDPWLMAQAIILITGQRGIGKSWFLNALLIAIAKKQGFGPWEAVNSEPSLYLDGEMAPQDTQERIFSQDQNGNKESPLYVYSDAYASSQGLPRANLLNSEWRKSMLELLLFLKVKVWAIDNIASLTPGIDENSKQEWDPINQWLLELRFNGITSILAHHTNRAGGQRGTSGREDNIDISILLKQPEGYTAEDGASFIASFTKARISIPNLPKIADCHFKLFHDQQGRPAWTYGFVKQKLKAEIVELHCKGLSNSEIAKELNCSRENVRRTVDRHKKAEDSRTQ